MSPRIWNPAKGGDPSSEISDLSRSHTVGSVLDVGCGWGRNLAAFAPRSEVLHGFDLDAEGVTATRERLALAGAAARSRVWCDDLLTADPGRTYDLVMCYGVLHFLRRADRHRAYALLRSWVRPGGLLAVASFNALVPIPDDLRELIPEPPGDSRELSEAFGSWPVVFARSHVFEDEHEGGIRHTHSIDRLIVRAG